MVNEDKSRNALCVDVGTFFKETQDPSEKLNLLPQSFYFMRGLAYVYLLLAK